MNEMGKLAKFKAITTALCMLAMWLNGTELQAQKRLSLSTSTLEFSTSQDEAIPTQTVLLNEPNSQITVGYMSPESGWLLATPVTDAASSKVVVSVDPQGLAPGLYMGYLKIASGESVSPVTVTFKVGPSKGIARLHARTPAVTIPPAAVNNITVDQASLNFQATWKSSQTKTLTISGSSTELVYLQSGVGWLRFNDLDYSVPSTITLIADSSGFASQPIDPLGVTLRVRGVTTGTVYASIPVTFTVTAGTAGGLTATPSALQFSQLSGGSVPASQTISLSASTATAFTVTSSASWLTATPTTGTTSGSTTTPTTLTISANGSGLSPNNSIPYQATLTIAGAGQSITIAVDLLVTTGATASLTALPTSLSFSQIIGGTLPDSKTVALTSTIATPFTVSTSASWLTVSLSTTAATTSNTLTVSANAAGLSAGTIQSSILITAGTSSVSIPVTFSISTVAPSITATPAALSLSQVLGGPAPGGKIVIDALTPTQFTASSNARWLTVTPSTTVTTAHEISVFVSQTLLSVGTYQAAVTITGGTSPVTIPVTLTITGAAVSASPTSLSFTQAPGAAAPPAQTVRIESNAALNFSVSPNANWLTVSPATGITPGSVTVSVNGSALAVGSYQSTITVSTATTTFDVPVTLSVAVPVLTVNLLPASLEFTAAAGASGASAPQPKSVSVTSSGAAFTFSAAASTIDRGNWLSVSPTSGSTPAQLSVALNINGMPQGQYTGAVTITPTDPAIATRIISVSLTLTNPGSGITSVTVKSVLNAASLQPGPLAPGEIVSIFGTGLGSASGAGPNVSAAGSIGTAIGDTRVLFEGIPAPLLYARADQINAIVPYGIHGRFASSMQVEVAGNRSEALQLRVDPAAPGLFTTTGTGSGQGAIVNQDGTVNGPIYPAPRGSIVSIYGTGEGQTRPGGQDGRIITTDMRLPIGQVTVKIAGAPAEVLYAGSAPGMVSGAFQVNVMIPLSAPPGGQIPLEVSVGGIASQVGVALAVK